MVNQLPDGWDYPHLDDLLTFKLGGDWGKDQEFIDPDYIEVLCIRASELRNWSEEKGSTAALRKIKKNSLTKRELKTGDILVEISGGGPEQPVGRTVLIDESVLLQNSEYKKVCTNFFRLIRPSCHVNAKYLNIFLQHFYVSGKISEFQSGSNNLRNLKFNDYLQVNIPLAPEKEQERIVAKIEELFSELDSGVASLKTAQEQLKIYRQAILKHAFEGKLTEQWRKDNADQLETPEQLLARIQTERETRYQQQLNDWKQAVKDWEAKGKEGKKPSKPAIHKPLSTISAEELEVLPELPKEWNYIRLAEIAAINSGMSVSKNRKLADLIEVNYLRVANVQRGYLDLSEIKSMNIEMVDLPRLQLEINDVLFNEGGDLDKLGRGWIWEGQVSQCITQNHVFRASPFVNEKYHAKFISYWGNSFGRDYFESGGKQTTNLASINKTVLSNFPIPLPSFREQQEIVNQLEEKLSIIEQNEKEIESALAKAELLRQSILKKAFSGQLHLGEKL